MSHYRTDERKVVIFKDKEGYQVNLEGERMMIVYYLRADFANEVCDITGFVSGSFHDYMGVTHSAGIMSCGGVTTARTDGVSKTWQQICNG
tara:strand:- start:720 stop:992 length:273 start_codon:yes stop_codon:yes gene_type:complete